MLHRGLRLSLTLILGPLKLRDLWHDLIPSVNEVRGICFFISLISVFSRCQRLIRYEDVAPTTATTTGTLLMPLSESLKVNWAPATPA